MFIKVLLGLSLLCCAIAAFPVLEGDNGTLLNCINDSPKNTSMFWTKENNNTFYIAGPLLIIPGGISRNDSGNYTCHKTDHVTNWTVVTTFVDVQYPAEITRFSVEPDNPMENQTVTVTCSVTGNPEPVWNLSIEPVHGRPIVYNSNLSGERTVTFPMYSCGFSSYTSIKCTGQNDLNRRHYPPRNDTTIRSSCPPRPAPNIPNNHTHVVPLGFNVRLREYVIGWPHSNFTWSRVDGKPMGKAVEFNTSTNPVPTSPTVAGLNIYGLTSADLGNYTLTVNNSVGYYTTVFQVATPPSFRTKQVQEGQNVIIDCSDQKSTGVRVYWTKGKDDTFYSTGSRLQISAISRNDGGNYTCHVSGHGTNQTVVTVFIDVQYPAEITHLSVDPENPIENQTITVTCSVAGNPEPVWNISENLLTVYSSNKSGEGTVKFPIYYCGGEYDIVCMAGNKLNTPLPAYNGTVVKGSCPPRPDPKFPTFHRRVVALGLNIHLRENVIGWPSPNFTWSRVDGKPMGDVAEYNSPNLAYLAIYGLRSSDLGNYTLTANNSLGKYTSVFQVETSTSTAATDAASSITGVIALLAAARMALNLLS